MRFKHVILFSFFCALLPAFAADSPPKIIPLSQTPPAVQKTIQAQLGNGKLGDIERVDDDDEITYEVETTRNGQSHDFTVAADGTLLRLELTLLETPAAVQRAIKAQVGTGNIESIEKTFDDGEIAYDVEMTTKNGVERSFTVAADGRLQMVEVGLEETPPAVRKTILEHAGKGKVGDIFRLLEADGISYDVEMTQDGKERDFSVLANGKLESAQMFLSELTPAVQKTIKDKIGSGKILRIDRKFEEKKGVIPFEIEGRKDGKPFNFSVGPKGRFLGMDD